MDLDLKLSLWQGGKLIMEWGRIRLESLPSNSDTANPIEVHAEIVPRESGLIVRASLPTWADRQ